MRRALRLLRAFSAAALLCGAELFLRLFSLRRLLGWADRLHRYCPFLAKGTSATLAAVLFRALPTVDERLPFLSPSCLRRALAARLILGPAAQVHIGVKPSGTGGIEAHAWVGPKEPDTGDFLELAAL